MVPRAYAHLLMLLAALLVLPSGTSVADGLDCAQPHPAIPDLSPWMFKTGDRVAFSAPDLDESDWMPIMVPAIWEREGYDGYDGFAWYRVHFRWEGALPCRPVGIRLGAIDDIDETFLNGTMIGRTGWGSSNKSAASDVRRIYPLPGRLIRLGDNVIAVRVLDRGGRGGIYEEAPRLGDLSKLLTEIKLGELIPALAPFLFVLIGIYHLLLFAFRPKARQNLYFFGFSLGVAALVINRNPLQSSLTFPPELLNEVSWMGAFVSAPLLVAFVEAHFQRTVPSAVRGMMWIMIVLTILSPFSPTAQLRTAVFFYLGQPIIVVLLIFIGRMLYQTARGGQRDPIWFAVGFLMLAATVIIEIIANTIAATGPNLIPLGMTLFLLFVVVLLANREVARTQELEQSAAALLALNQSLESQVLDRTRHLETARAQLETQNAQLAEFNSLVSHDLKAPVRGLETIAEFLENDYRNSLDAEGQRLLNLIRDAARQMRGLLEGLHTFVKMDQQEELSAVSVQSVAKASQALLAGAFLRAHGALVIEDGLPEVLGNRTRLIEVLSNLVINGLKYNLNDRPLVVIRAAGPEEIGSRIIAPGQTCVAVSDNGMGIPAEFQEQIFEPFKRLHSGEKFEGSGVGLAIVRKALRSMGGDIWVQSTPGTGATFYFVLSKVEKSG